MIIKRHSSSKSYWRLDPQRLPVGWQQDEQSTHNQNQVPKCVLVVMLILLALAAAGSQCHTLCGTNLTAVG